MKELGPNWLEGLLLSRAIVLIKIETIAPMS